MCSGYFGICTDINLAINSSMLAKLRHSSLESAIKYIQEALDGNILINLFNINLSK